MNWQRVPRQIRDVVAWHLALEAAVGPTRAATLTIVEAEQHLPAPHTETPEAQPYDPQSTWDTGRQDGDAPDASVGAAVPPAHSDTTTEGAR